MPSRIEISPKTILFIAAFVFTIWFVIVIRDVLFLLFISFIIMSALRPLVDRLASFHIPRMLAAFIVYLLLTGLIIVFGYFVFPPLVSETLRLLTNFPQYIERITPYVQIDGGTLVNQLAPIGQNVAKLTVSVFSNILSIITVTVFSFYFTLERNHLTDFLETFLGKAWGKRVVTIINKTEERMGAWVRGQLFLMVIIGMVTYIGLSLLNISYALPLAMIAGMLEIVPFIGPNIAGFLGVLVAFVISPGLALAVAAMYFIVQQLENNLIVPSVMRRTVGLPPIVSLLALMIGGRLAGALGVVLAVPMFLLLQTVITELMSQSNES